MTESDTDAPAATDDPAATEELPDELTLRLMSEVLEIPPDAMRRIIREKPWRPDNC